MEFSKPTEEELAQTKQMVEEKYDFVIPQADLVKLVQLIKELNYWLEADKSKSPKIVTEEMALELRDLTKEVKGEDITLSEAYDGARSVLTLAPVLETERISKKIRAIIAANRPVPYSTEVQDKTAKLFSLHYGVDLTAEQLEQVVQYLTRKLWYEEGLDVSLEDCLDDLLVYADRRKRGKRTKSVGLHDTLRKALDLVMKDLKIGGKEFDPLYREQD